MYPLNRNSKDLQDQINLLLGFLDDDHFIEMVRTWTLEVLNGTLMDQFNPDLGTFGSDKHWYASMASETQQLSLAGTFRAALAGKISNVVTSLFTVLLAHLDRNYGMHLLADKNKRDIWIKLQTDSLNSQLSGRLLGDKVSALKEHASTQHEVSTDAQTPAKPFISKFPASWFVASVLTTVRPQVENLSKENQLTALVSHFNITKLHEIGFDPELGGDRGLLEDYLSDLTAMHLDFTERLSRDKQTLIMRKSLERAKGGPLTGILEMHQLFWNQEKFIALAVGLLNEAPQAIDNACALIENEKLDWETLDLEFLLLIIRTLNKELLQQSGGVPQKEVYREWNRRKQVVSGFTQDYLARCKLESNPSYKELVSIGEPMMDTLSLLLSHVAHPLDVPLEHVNNFAAALPSDTSKGEKIRDANTLQAMFNFADKIGALDTDLNSMGNFVESWILDVGLGSPEAMKDLDANCLELFCALACGLPLKVAGSTVVAGAFGEWKDFVNVCIATCPSGGQIPRSECMNLALLKKLLGDPKAGDARQLAEKHIHKLLQDLKDSEGHSDTTFATKFAVLQEETAIKKLKDKPVADWDTYRLEDVFPEGPQGNNPAKMLQHIGTTRFMLSKYAMLLCDVNLGKRAAEFDDMTAKVEHLLMTSDPLLEGVCRSMRLFLLKCMRGRRACPSCGVRWQRFRWQTRNGSTNGARSMISISKSSLVLHWFLNGIRLSAVSARQAL
jgi:hypothetical protein